VDVRNGVLCPECGDIDHQPIAEDEAHCPCNGDTGCRCACHSVEKFSVSKQVVA